MPRAHTFRDDPERRGLKGHVDLRSHRGSDVRYYLNVIETLEEEYQSGDIDKDQLGTELTVFGLRVDYDKSLCRSCRKRIHRRWLGCIEFHAVEMDMEAYRAMKWWYNADLQQDVDLEDFAKYRQFSNGQYMRGAARAKRYWADDE